MIHKNESNSKEFAFWASNVYYMNDTKEITILYDELIKILPKIENDLGLSDNLLSEIVFPDNFVEDKSAEDIIKSFFYECLYRHVYVISFSDQRDTLPMWSMYGKNGNGLCLVFDIDKVNNFLDNHHKVNRVYYSLDTKPVYDYLVEKYKRYYYEKDTSALLKKIGLIVSVFLGLSGKVKNSAYSFEQEYRIIENVIDEDDLSKWPIKLNEDNIQPIEKPNYVTGVKVRVQNGLMIPYVEIKLPIECLSAVIIGPSINQKLQREGLRILLAGTHLKDEDIILSDIPYRSIR
jgi:Protein of unknown function (DUF2971).